MELTLSQLDFNEPGELPAPIKLIIFLLLVSIVWGGGYYFVIQDKQKQLASIEQKELQLKKDFEAKQAKAVNLQAYKEQLAEMEIMFSSMLDQLPRKREIPDLLNDVTRTGLINGLQFQLFQPQGERRTDFYSELPIKMIIRGNYHQFGRFVSGLASLPRIVTLHDFTIKSSSSDSTLTMEVLGKTYRYFDENDEE
jgi:type IV pilus assembly protein PilO